MRTILLAALLLTTTLCSAQNRVQILAKAIAKAEGYGHKGALPTRYRNPGDLKAVHGWRYPGQLSIGKGGHIRFRTDADGWSALEHQLNKMIEDDSKRYSVNMTLQEFSKKYAGNSRVWLGNVAHYLGVPPDTMLWEILDIPPTLKEKP